MGTVGTKGTVRTVLILISGFGVRVPGGARLRDSEPETEINCPFTALKRASLPGMSTSADDGMISVPPCSFRWERADKQIAVETPGPLWHPVHDCSLHPRHVGDHQCRCEATAPYDAAQDESIPPALFLPGRRP